MSAKERTVESYLAALPADQRAALEKVRRAIRAAAPGAEECFSYGIPAFRLDGKLVAGFSASARHCSYFPMSGRTIAALEAELVDYQTSKGAVRFPPARPLPAALVRRLVKARIGEEREP